jgi:CRP/FNR family transcriptional regulator, cyclic AMP receptor protein
MNQPQPTPHENAELRDFLSRPGAGKSIGVYQRDDDIFVQGQVADSIFYIQKGCVKLVASRQGREFIAGIFQAGQFVGEGSLNGAAFRLASMRAMEESRLTSISIPTMREALQDCPGLAELFTAHLLSRNSRIEADMMDQKLNSTEMRLARLLVILANFRGNNGLPTPINFSQTTLAEMIGSTRSRVSRFMNRFRKLGLISYRDGIIDVHRSLWKMMREIGTTLRPPLGAQWYA